MAFKLHSTDDGRVPPIWYKNGSGFTPRIGLALKVTGGKLALATGTTKPTFICMTEMDEELTSDSPAIPVMRVSPEYIFEVEAKVELWAGDTFSLDSNGEKITAGEGSGVVDSVLYGDSEDFDATSNNKVLVRFV